MWIVTFFLTGFALSPGAAAEGVHEINFGKSSKYGRYITASELSQWGLNRKLSLVRDCSFRDLQDFEAEVIGASGMQFTLDAPGEGRIFIYLDLVTFLPQTHYEPSQDEQYCLSSEESRYYPEFKNAVSGVRYLEIIVNGHSLKTVYTGEGTFLLSPVKIEVDREFIFRRKLNVTLKPSPGETFFAVWDVYTSKHGEKM